MSDLSNLTVPGKVYVHVPPASRNQDFIAYTLTGDISESLTYFCDKFNHPYYLLDLRNNPKAEDKVIVVIPFSQSIKNRSLDTLSINEIDNNFQRMLNGESYRNRSKTATFTFENPKQPLINPKDFVDDGKPRLDIKKVQAALKQFIKTPRFIKLNNDSLKRRQFLQTLANDAYNDIYSSSDIASLLKILSPKIKNLTNEYQAAAKDIQASNVLRNKAQPLGEYLQLYQQSESKSPNITDQMLDMIDQSVEPDPKMPLPDAGNIIEQVYPPALLKRDGRDYDNVVIFDGTRGMWIHDEDAFMGLLTALRPWSNPNSLKTLINTFAADARNKSNYIEPYSKSRYLLFKNCVYDVKEDRMLSLNSTEVKDLHLTERNYIDLNYNPKVVDPPKMVGENGRKFGDKPWDPYTFLLAYAGNDPEKLHYLLFGLSLGLFGGHNFGVHFDLKGDSRWGKTTLSAIYRRLYPKRVLMVPYVSLNSQFGLTNFRPDLSVVWIRECNNESAPLNNEYGITNYDALADPQVEIQVKSQLDLIVDNPPQVYVDGTSYVKAEDIDTGPAGRTLPYKLPMNGDFSRDTIQALVRQAYAKTIEKNLQDEQVLQFIVNKMIWAYRTFLHFSKPEQKDTLWDLKLNLGGNAGDNNLFPPFVAAWKKEMVQTQGDLSDWFKWQFEPYLSKDSDEPTHMHDDLAYALYADAYRQQHARQDPTNRFRLSLNSFKRQFDKLLEQAGWHKSNLYDSRGNKTRRTMKYLSNTNFNVDKFQNDGNTIPSELKKDSIESHPEISSYPLGSRTYGWYDLDYSAPVSDNPNNDSTAQNKEETNN